MRRNAAESLTTLVLNMTWRSKLTVLLLAFSVVPAISVAYWSFNSLMRTFEDSTLQGLQAVADAKAEAVGLFTSDRRGNVERVSTLLSGHVERLQAARAATQAPPAPPPLPELEDAEALESAATEGEERQRKGEVEEPEQAPAPDAYLTGAQQEEAQALAELRRTLALILWDQRDFEELLVLGRAGQVLASTYEAHEGKTAENLDYFQAGRSATFVQPLFLSPITERLTMMISTPIRGNNMDVVGVLAARLNLKQFYRLVNDRAGLGDSGETVVGKKVEDEVVFMAPTRHDPHAALSRKIALGDPTSRALQESARGHRGSGVQQDYRGVVVFAAWEHVPELDWGLLVKIDEQEALSGLREVRDRIIYSLVILLLLIAWAATTTAAALVRPIKQLRNAADRLSRGDLNVQLDIRSKDEIGELANSFERMVAAVRYFRERPTDDDANGAEEPGSTENADVAPVSSRGKQ